MASRIWKLKPNFDKNRQELDKDFFLFGYSCKLFRDDETAFYIDQGKHLIPWMGDESLLIDRYDGRGHLSDLRAYDSEFVIRNLVEKTATEKAVEEQCDRERYLELKVDIDEERVKEEEEWKRYYEAVNGGDFNAVGFSYDNQYDPSEPTDTEITDDSALNEPYVPPQDLALPPETITPATMKHHAIIEKTAQCISVHGVQMEIMIKARQTDNPQFDFLHYDHQLYPYYRHLVNVIKSGFYVPKGQSDENEKQNAGSFNDNKDDDEEDDDDDDVSDTYLHPSLMVKKTESKVAPLVISMEGTAYGSLVQNLKDMMPKLPIAKKTAQAPSPPPCDGTHSPAQSTTAGESGLDSPMVSDRSRSSTPTVRKRKVKSALRKVKAEKSESVMYGPTIVQPPADLQPIIDRMAQYVVKNGQDFEEVVKSKKDKRFTFILPGDVHNSYYEYKKSFFFDEKKKDDEEQRLSANRSISFSLKAKPKDPEPVIEPSVTFHDESTDDEGTDTIKPPGLATAFAMTKPPEPHSTTDHKKSAEEKIRDRLAAAARVRNANATKDKHLQAERKKRAAMFVNMLKSSAVTTAVTATATTTTTTTIAAEATPTSIVATPTSTPHRSRSNTPLASPSHSIDRAHSPQTFDYNHTLSAPKRTLTLPSAYRSSETVDVPPTDRPSPQRKVKERHSKRARSRSPSKKTKSKSSKRDKSPSSKHKSKHKSKKRRSHSETNSDKQSRVKHSSREESSVVPIAKPPTISHAPSDLVTSADVEPDPLPELSGAVQDTSVPMSDVQICQFRAMVKARQQAFWDEKKSMDNST